MTHSHDDMQAFAKECRERSAMEPPRRFNPYREDPEGEILEKSSQMIQQLLDENKKLSEYKWMYEDLRR